MGFYSCDFNQSSVKDLTTGAYTRGDGIGSADVSLEINDVAENRNTFVYGEQVKFVFDGITGLTRENENAFPGLSMCIVKNQTDTVLYNPDLLAETDGGIGFSPLQLYATFLAIFPYEEGEEYMAYVNIWDKKGDGTFTHEMPFTVVKNEVLDLKTTELDYTDIYLWNDTDQLVVVKNQMNFDKAYIAIFEGLKGFTEEKSKVFPALSLKVTDSAGNVLLTDDNTLASFQEEGIDPSELSSQLIVDLSFTEGQVANPCTLSAVLSDLRSGKNLEMKTVFDLK